MDGFVARLAEESTVLEHKLEPIPSYYALRHDLPPIPRLPDDRESQEALISEDLICLLRGCEGAYIHFNTENGGFEPNQLSGRMRGPDLRVPRAVDSALRDVAVDIAEVARHHIAVAAFAEYLSAPEQGKVNHALSAALISLSQNFLELVASIERDRQLTGDISLHTLLLSLMPAKRVLEQAYRLTKELIYGASDADSLETHDAQRMDIRGGAVLSLLAKRLERHNGNPAARELYRDLLREASRPYLSILTQWLYKGAINDPFDEFMIEEHETIASELVHRDSLNAYWEKRYSLRPGALPLHLSAPDVAEQILLAGKYLNVIRECGGEEGAAILAAVEVPEFTSIEDPNLILAISQAYQRANQTLLKLLIHDHNLMARLQSLKHYYFFDKNDAFPLFLETAAKELGRPVGEASTRRLQYSLDMALAQPGSSSSHEPYADEVVVTVAEDSITDALLRVVQVRGDRDFDDVMETSESIEKEVNLTALESIVLDFDIPFPESLVISRPAILCYQFLFRHLLRIKVVEQSLNSLWLQIMGHSIWRRRSAIKEFEAWKTRALELRGKMTNFIEQLLYYCSADVIERSSAEFFATIDSAKTIDNLKTDHVNYLDRCLTDCMLTAPEFLCPQRELLQTISNYSHWLQSHTPQLGLVDSSNLTAKEKSRLMPQSTKDGFASVPELIAQLNTDLDAFERDFSQALVPFFDTLNEAAYDSGALRSLLVRLEPLVSSV